MDADRNHTVIVYEILNLSPFEKICSVSLSQRRVIQVYLLICRPAKRNRRPVFIFPVFPVYQNRCKRQKSRLLRILLKRFCRITGIQQDIPGQRRDAFQADGKRFRLIEGFSARNGKAVRVFFADQRFKEADSLTDGYPL